MTEQKIVDMPGAFEMLLEEMEAQISLITKAVAQAVQKGEFDAAKKAIGQAERLTVFRNRVADLRDEWDQDLSDNFPEERTGRVEGLPKKNLGRLRRGLRTNEHTFYMPILQALSELGGSAKMRNVIDRVGELMKKQLKPVDYEPLPSDPETIRWRNTAQWARNSLVKRGLLKGDSQHGTWEITAEGRGYLKEQAER
jgi:restriction system protein